MNLTVDLSPCDHLVAAMCQRCAAGAAAQSGREGRLRSGSCQVPTSVAVDPGVQKVGPKMTHLEKHGEHDERIQESILR